MCHHVVYVGDNIGRIRRIDAKTGLIDTVAGVGLSGYTGDGGPATQARIGSPSGISPILSSPLLIPTASETAVPIVIFFILCLVSLSLRGARRAGFSAARPGAR